MIKIKGAKDYLVALESVTMTDIVLNMFIFFFISFSLLYTFNPNIMSKLEIKLPKASSAMSLEGSEKVILIINKSGEYFINDEKLRSIELKGALEKRLRENSSLGILLKVDALARFDSVVSALDVINELKVQKVSVAAVKKES